MVLCKVFKPLYYWAEGRQAVMQNPEKFLKQEGLVGHAFMLHPFKLSERNAQQIFLKVTCLSQLTAANNWLLTIGIILAPS